MGSAFGADLRVRSTENKNRIPLCVRTKLRRFEVIDPKDGTASVQEREIVELVFKTSYSSNQDIERTFGRMHFNHYDEYEYPFETGVLQFWKAVDWREVEKVESKKLPTGQFRKKRITPELIDSIERDKWDQAGSIPKLLKGIESFLNSTEMAGKVMVPVSIPREDEVAIEGGEKVEEEIEEELLTHDKSNLLTEAIRADIVNSIRKHTKYLRMRGEEIMRSETFTTKLLEIEFKAFIVVIDDAESASLIAGMKACVDEIREKVETLRRWRADGVPSEERDYVFSWDREDGDPAQKPKGFDRPFDHQWVMYKTHTLLESSADLSDMGTGKTLSCLMTIDKRIQDGEIRKGHILIVAPTTTLELAWQKQIKMFTPHLSSKIVRGSYTERMMMFMEPTKTRGDILLINYEAFAMDTTIINKNGEKKIIPLSKLCEFVNWDMVVLDECHKIKNPEAKRTDRIIETFRKTKHKLIMSGTINANKLHDVHVPFVHMNNAANFNSLHHTRNGDELSLGELHGDFKSAYFSRYGRSLIPKPGTLHELREKLEEVSVRFEKKECLSLPDKMYIKEELEMSVKQKQLYLALRDRLIADLTDIQEDGGKVSAVHVFAKLTKLAEAANGWIYNNAGKAIELPWNPKLDRVKEIIGDINLDTQKVVVWSRFTHDLHLLSAMLKKEYGDDAVVVIHGGSACSCGSDSKKRSEHVNQFLDMSEGNKVKIAILNQATGSHGIDLTSATYEIFYSNSFSKTDRLQSEDRCHRTGMRESLTIIDLICKETVDEQIMQALMTHKAITTALLEALGLFDLAEEDQRAPEPPVINIQQQGHMECLLASCAMIAGKTIEEARVTARRLGIEPWVGSHENMLKVLDSWNIKLTTAWDMQGDEKKGIAIVKWPVGGSHAVAFHAGQVYDPIFERPKSVRKWLSDMTEKGGSLSKIMVVVPEVGVPVPASAGVPAPLAVSAPQVN